LERDVSTLLGYLQNSHGIADLLTPYLLPVQPFSQAIQDSWVQSPHSEGLPEARFVTVHFPMDCIAGTDLDPSTLLNVRPRLTLVDKQPRLSSRRTVGIPEFEVVENNDVSTVLQISKERARELAAHQVDLIMDARDFRGALDALLTFERFSLYDLQDVLDATRPTFFQWRKAPVKKLRKDNASRLRLLFGTWKQWLFLGNGAPLGQWIHASTSKGSLASILRSPGSTMTGIESAIEELLPVARRTGDTQLHYRRFVAGLPQAASNHDYNVEMAI
jgi:hypothetical protein